MEKQKILHIVYEGDIWIVNTYNHYLISEVMNVALSHFVYSKDSDKSASMFKLIRASTKQVLNPHLTVEEEELTDYDEIILAGVSESMVPSIPRLEDIKGPSKEEVMAATLNLTKRSPVQIVPEIDCPEIVEINKVLYSLVEASIKILSSRPDSKVVFDGIATRIMAKNKKEVDKCAVKFLKDLGFTEVQARYALYLKRNRQVEAMEWLLENSDRVKEDTVVPTNLEIFSSVDNMLSGSEDPLQTMNRLLQEIREFHQRHFEPSTWALESLTTMGFTRDDTVEALRLTGNSLPAACEWLCGERDLSQAQDSPGLDHDSPLHQALKSNPAIQLGLHNPKVLLAFLSILENHSSANLWINDADVAPVLGQVFKTYHTEKNIMTLNQQLELLKRQNKQ